MEKHFLQNSFELSLRIRTSFDLSKGKIRTPRESDGKRDQPRTSAKASASTWHRAQTGLQWTAVRGGHTAPKGVSLDGRVGLSSGYLDRDIWIKTFETGHLSRGVWARWTGTMPTGETRSLTLEDTESSSSDISDRSGEGSQVLWEASWWPADHSNEWSRQNSRQSVKWREWSRMEQNGGEWSRVEQNGAEWSRMKRRTKWPIGGQQTLDHNRESGG